MILFCIHIDIIYFLGPSDQTIGHVLINGWTYNAMFLLQMDHAILLMRKFALTFGTLKRVFPATFILQVSIEVVIPFIGSLTMGTDM